MHIEAVVALLGGIETAELLSWVERGWVQPDAAGALWEFREIDIARARLVRDLRRDMDVSDEAMPIVLSLLDQVYDLRCALRRLTDALDRQPAALRAAVLEAME
ncbi:MAG TPA: chaperone modulator CbpM [Acetobacteraceae bacterium]|nr:chaperone modulator CbpM [Acetobacteraceae bacterium]